MAVHRHASLRPFPSIQDGRTQVPHADFWLGKRKDSIGEHLSFWVVNAQVHHPDLLAPVRADNDFGLLQVLHFRIARRGHCPLKRANEVERSIRPR